MTKALVISIDGLGGDHAPSAVVDGLEIAAARLPDVRFLLHGPQAEMEAALAAKPSLSGVTEIRHVAGRIGMDVKPAQALRQGRDTSMWNAIAAVENDEAQVCVSGGNTGALLAISMMRLRRMEGVHRPALVANWPTMKGGFAAVLDVGATVEAEAEQLVEFAIMGAAFHRAVHNVARPTVGLLNVGSEDEKGHEEIRAAARLIRERAIDIDFKGFIEGDDIGKGVVDVVVTDGFTGNVALKTAEGTARMVGHFLRESLGSGPFARIGAAIAYPALKKLKARMDPRAANGAMFLGLNGLVVKSHGGSDGLGFAAAVNVAARMARSHFRDEVAANLSRLSVQPAAAASAS
jgi:glycerol-3-phosphate acyltransferase PlsX